MRELASNDIGIDILNSQIFFLVAAFALQREGLLLLKRLIQL